MGGLVPGKNFFSYFLGEEGGPLKYCEVTCWMLLVFLMFRDKMYRECNIKTLCYESTSKGIKEENVFF